MKKRDIIGEMVVFTANIVALLVEIHLFTLLLHENLSIEEYLISHFGLILFSVGVALAAWNFNFNMNYPILSLVFITFLGPFGAIIGIISLLLFVIYKPFTPQLEDLLETLAPDVSLSLSERVYQRLSSEVLVSGSNEPPINYQDIISLGTTKQKQIAIAKMLKYFEPEFSPILFTAIDDPVSAIRVLAATALNTIDQRYSQAKVEQEEVVAQAPHKSLEIKKLAILCQKYANSGILEKDRKDKVIKSAIEAYQKYLAIVKYDLDASNALAKIFLNEKRLNEAKLLLANSVENLKKIDSASLLNYAEILYELKDYSSLRSVLSKEINDSNEYSQNYRSVAELKEIWLN